MSAPPNHWLIALLTLISTVSLLWRLDQGSLFEDEAVYAQVSKEMLQSGSWLTPHWDYETWFHKPPLYMWITTTFYRLFQVNEFWSRAASAFSGVGLVIVTYLIGKFAYNKQVGFLSAVILLTSAAVVFQARFGTLDVMLTLFIYFSIYAYLHVREGNQKWWYSFWVSCALAILTKGAAGLVVPITIAVALVLDRRSVGLFSSRYFWQGILLSLLIVAPWHLLMYLQHGQKFIDEYVSYHIIARAATALEGNTGTRTYYLEILRAHFSPWCYLLPFAFALSLKDIIKGKSQSSILLIVIVIVLVLYTLVPTKLQWYIMPAYPAMAILTAALFLEACKYTESMAFTGLATAAFLLIFVASAKIVLLFGSAGTLIFLLFWRRLACRQVAILIGVFLITVGLNSLRPLYDKKAEPIAELARLAVATPDDRETLIVFDKHGASKPTALFYSNRPILIALTHEELTRYIENYRAERIILPKESVKWLSTAYKLHIVAEAGPFVYATF